MNIMLLFIAYWEKSFLDTMSSNRHFTSAISVSNKQSEINYIECGSTHWYYQHLQHIVMITYVIFVTIAYHEALEHNFDRAV